ncbi:hypothetical protein ABT187_43025, partial [Streptomyces sp. NPDC001817]
MSNGTVDVVTTLVVVRRLMAGGWASSMLVGCAAGKVIGAATGKSIACVTAGQVVACVDPGYLPARVDAGCCRDVFAGAAGVAEVVVQAVA